MEANFNFFDKVNDEVKKMPKANIVIVGKTGVGKSTLINAVFRENLAETGIGQPVTQHLRKYSKEEIPIRIYDTKGLELNSNVQENIRKEINDEIQKSLLSTNNDEFVHVCWFCINDNASRIENYEIDWINELSEKIPVILVLTQSYGDKIDFFNYLKNLNLKAKIIIRILATPYTIHNLTIPSFGLDTLVKSTYEILPEAVRHAFANSQKISIELKVKEARNWSLAYISSTFAVGFTPIPFSDAALLIPIQIGMLAHITAIFGISIDKAFLSTVVSSIAGSGGAMFLGRWIVSNLIKLVPGIGTVAGGIISGSTASILTTALAFGYISVMELVWKAEMDGKKMSSTEIAEKIKEEFSKEIDKKNQ